MSRTDEHRTPVSIVCVFNDPEVRASTLDRSIRALQDSAPQTEYLPVDNTAGRFSSAGAALNDGARRARHEVVVFVHQDVYLHSLVDLERAAAALQDDPTAGLVGAVGVTASGAVAGVVRDRVVMIGRPSSPTVPVDSVDEVLFLIERERVLAEPLSEHPDLAWHAYAVEYGARVRAHGLRVVTHDVALTHNSMTTNLDRLAEAHHFVATLYPELLPMHTTCGVVRASPDRAGWRTTLRRRHGAATWLRESVAAVRLARRGGRRVRDVVLGDIRLTIDDVLDLTDASGLDVVNLDARASGTWQVTGLTRRGRDVAATDLTLDRLVPELATLGRERPLLVTGVDGTAVARLAPDLHPGYLVGIAQDTGAWLLSGSGMSGLHGPWPARRNAPFGIRPRGAAGSRTSAGAPAELAR